MAKLNSGGKKASPKGTNSSGGSKGTSLTSLVKMGSSKPLGKPADNSSSRVSVPHGVPVTTGKGGLHRIPPASGSRSVPITERYLRTPSKGERELRMKREELDNPMLRNLNRKLTNHLAMFEGISTKGVGKLARIWIAEWGRNPNLETRALRAKGWGKREFIPQLQAQADPIAEFYTSGATKQYDEKEKANLIAIAEDRLATNPKDSKAQVVMLTLAYGVNLTSSRANDPFTDWRAWEDVGINNVYLSVTDVANKFQAVSGVAPYASEETEWALFHKLLGTVVVELSDEQYYSNKQGDKLSIESSAQTIAMLQDGQYFNLIKVYANRTEGLQQNQQNANWFQYNMVHELGHVFNNRLRGYGTNRLDDGIITADNKVAAYNEGWGDSNEVGFPRQNAADLIGEEWADMLLFWVYGGFNKLPEGIARQKWMDDNMKDFVNRASARSLGIVELVKYVLDGGHGTLQDGRIATNGMYLNVRNQPDGSTNHNIITSVPNGSAITVIGRSADGQWLAISYNDTVIGWVSAENTNISSVGQLPVYTPDEIAKLTGK